MTCLGENTEKYKIFTVPMEKEVTRIDKNGEEITKNMSSSLWQIHIQILSIIFLNKFIELNENSDTMI